MYQRQPERTSSAASRVADIITITSCQSNVVIDAYEIRKRLLRGVLMFEGRRRSEMLLYQAMISAAADARRVEVRPITTLMPGTLNTAPACQAILSNDDISAAPAHYALA